ncbi:hypothetical protein TrCOL_g4525 [Triparma columacea]|uniref:Uncharacterized protein n=1 Tax=Triparma columacea TaxID=722753 RepID=A0A9W7G8F5_9STRA|nr:hypothetical protein TrCOL_g4525 [Triparma columacea]
MVKAKKKSKRGSSKSPKSNKSPTTLPPPPQTLASPTPPTILSNLSPTSPLSALTSTLSYLSHVSSTSTSQLAKEPFTLPVLDALGKLLSHTDPVVQDLSRGIALNLTRNHITLNPSSNPSDLLGEWINKGNLPVLSFGGNEDLLSTWVENGYVSCLDPWFVNKALSVGTGRLLHVCSEVWGVHKRGASRAREVAMVRGGGDGKSGGDREMLHAIGALTNMGGGREEWMIQGVLEVMCKWGERWKGLKDRVEVARGKAREEIEDELLERSVSQSVTSKNESAISIARRQKSMDASLKQGLKAAVKSVEGGRDMLRRELKDMEDIVGTVNLGCEVLFNIMIGSGGEEGVGERGDDEDEEGGRWWKDGGVVDVMWGLVETGVKEGGKGEEDVRDRVFDVLGACFELGGPSISMSKVTAMWSAMSHRVGWGLSGPSTVGLATSFVKIVMEPIDREWARKAVEGAEPEEALEFLVALAGRGDEHHEDAVKALLDTYERGGTDVRDRVAVGLMDVYGGEEPRRDAVGKMNVMGRVGGGMSQEVEREWRRFQEYVNGGWR